MNTVVQVFHKHVYGVQRIYPANETAKQFAELLQVKTLAADQLRQIRELGYSIERVFD
jgi:hypothetical protein